MKIKRLLQSAYRTALGSNDKSTAIGALLTRDSTILVRACNSMPRSFEADPKNHERPRKYQVTEHAERAVIFKAARRGIQTEGLTLICPLAACSDCARAIVLAGIVKVVVHGDAMARLSDRWISDCEIGLEILREGEVDFEEFDGKVGNVENLLNSEIWFP